MEKIKRHIAVVLLVIFIFPITYQSLHIYEHTTGDCSSDCHSCSINLSDNTSMEFTLDARMENCLICKYELSITEIPDLTIYRAQLPIIDFRSDESNTKKPFIQLVSQKSPRAPPVHIYPISQCL